MPDPSSERGESLVELLVTIAIIGIAVIALVAGLATAIVASGAHRQQADAGAIARNVAEEIKDVDQPFVDAGGDYGSAWSDVDPKGTSIAVSTQCWNGDTPATFAGCPAGDRGLQQITVSVSDDGASESVTILKRRIDP